MIDYLRISFIPLTNVCLVPLCSWPCPRTMKWQKKIILILNMIYFMPTFEVLDFSLCMCVRVWVCAHECGAFWDQKRALDALELRLQGVVSCLPHMDARNWTQVQCERAICPPKHRADSLASCSWFLISLFPPSSFPLHIYIYMKSTYSTHISCDLMEMHF